MYFDPYFYFRYAMFANWFQKDLEENFRHAEVNKINLIQIKDNTTTSRNYLAVYQFEKPSRST